MKRRHIPRDPCRATNPDHRAALAWMAAQGIDGPRGIGFVKVDTLVKVTLGPVIVTAAADPRKMRLV